MDIYFLRHGQSITAGTYTGVTDVVLSRNGISQIQEVSTYLNHITFDHCYCSPLERCRRSFELLDIDVSCEFDKQLQEIDFGRWETRSFDELFQEDQQTMDQWYRLKEHFTFPGGDNISEFSLRIKNWFEKLQNERYKNVLVVSHGGVIRHALVHLLGLAISKADQFEVLEGHVSMVSVENGFGVLRFLNKVR